MTNIIVTIYFAAILAALILRHKHQNDNLTATLSLVKGLSFTVAKSEETFELENETDHHFQIGFGFVMLTMSWTTKE